MLCFEHSSITKLPSISATRHKTSLHSLLATSPRTGHSLQSAEPQLKLFLINSFTHVPFRTFSSLPISACSTILLPISSPQQQYLYATNSPSDCSTPKPSRSTSTSPTTITRSLHGFREAEGSVLIH